MPAQKPDNKHDWILNTSGNARNGQWYYLEDHTSSAGVSGKFHVYYDGTKEWLADMPTPLPTAGPSPAMTVPPAGLPAWNPPAAAPAPAPAPTPAPPVQPNGGVQAPLPDGTYALVPDSVGVATPTVTPGPASSTPPSDNSGGTQPSDDGNTIISIPTGETLTPSNPDEGNTVIGIPTGETLSPVNSDDGNTIISIPTGETNPAISVGAPSKLDTASASVQDDLQQASSRAAGGTIYTVVAGDTMWDIAQANNMSLEQLVALNPNIDNPDLIIPGQQISLGSSDGNDIPGVSSSGSAAESFPAASSYETPAASSSTESQDTENRGVGGWSDGTSSVPKDPVNNIPGTNVPQIQTDPLKINDDKLHED